MGTLNRGLRELQGTQWMTWFQNFWTGNGRVKYMNGSNVMETCTMKT